MVFVLAYIVIASVKIFCALAVIYGIFARTAAGFAVIWNEILGEHSAVYRSRNGFFHNVQSKLSESRHILLAGSKSRHEILHADKPVKSGDDDIIGYAQPCFGKCLTYCHCHSVVCADYGVRENFTLKNILDSKFGGYFPVFSVIEHIVSVRNAEFGENLLETFVTENGGMVIGLFAAYENGVCYVVMLYDVSDYIFVCFGVICYDIEAFFMLAVYQYNRDFV